MLELLQLQLQSRLELPLLLTNCSFGNCSPECVLAKLTGSVGIDDLVRCVRPPNAGITSSVDIGYHHTDVNIATTRTLKLLYEGLLLPSTIAPSSTVICERIQGASSRSLACLFKCHRYSPHSSPTLGVGCLARIFPWDFVFWQFPLASSAIAPPIINKKNAHFVWIFDAFWVLKLIKTTLSIFMKQTEDDELTSYLRWRLSAISDSIR